MNAVAVAVPYESQTGAPANRDCGAACLSMVYRSLGKEVGRNKIWPAIAKPNRMGSMASTTHLMAKDALSRGLAALAIQARHPLQVLKVCHDSGVRAILNHRLRHDEPTGHYSTLVDIDDKTVALHDPLLGPSRRLTHAELLDLWRPKFPGSEIAGFVLVAIAVESPAMPACWLCHTPVSAVAACPNCKEDLVLQPRAVLGCSNDACLARMWNFLCCPACDYTWSFSNATSKELAQRPPEAAKSEEDPLSLNRAFAEMDKFCKFVMSNAEAAAHPEIRNQLALIALCKEKLILAQTEAVVRQKANQERLADVVQAANQRAEAHSKAMEELNRPSPPLDAHALGRALLRSLGYSD